ncbi:hypothetical protein SPOG_02881 [Schizosaccharomyces cryophilus OY26]|uniref:GXWXG protein n=1 Tax=Schizosaccharomyces cryophilus (strain OY26 / ATCC MYA-4695 / CBS 11777 / NBRC 106824 / NRRL Y48691) TaxID=653667 RepID=S9W1K8_SCHCR|nr:uncharacterized protein SPOG_02881 [Schizosaccharomyces cryophilus OY26]EPY53893.1 hypothetical protein SPOG_02881 [Schizosaccharomyces cryophilus OY26]
MIAPEKKFFDLTRVTGHIPEKDVETIFDKLKPVSPSFMIGEWTGGDFDTGHIGHKYLTDMRWAGKAFRSLDDGDPILIYNDKGQRVWNKDWGHASLREMVFRNVTSTSMIYDEKPIFDHFRFITDDMVAGAMESPKMFGTESTYYFYLTRLK